MRGVNLGFVSSLRKTGPRPLAPMLISLYSCSLSRSERIDDLVVRWGFFPKKNSITFLSFQMASY